jgi:hypothetical protein
MMDKAKNPLESAHCNFFTKLNKPQGWGYETFS